MKNVIVLLLTIVGFCSASQANQKVYECMAAVDLGDGTTTKLGISVFGAPTGFGYQFESKLTGSSDDTQILPTKKEFSTPQFVSEFVTVPSIIQALNLSNAQLASVQNINIYTAGNFDDDAAGVKAIELLDANLKIIAKGMFFGWAGIHKCQ